ncbi:hypothetical protein Tco_0811486 [Tanacetum coccineum]
MHAKRKAEKNRESEGAGGSEGSSKRRKEKSSDHIPCPTPLRTIVAVASDVSRGDNVISLTQTQGDNLLNSCAQILLIPPTRLYEEKHDDIQGVGADGAGSSLPPSLFVPSWGIHQRSRVTTPEECRDLMSILFFHMNIPPPTPDDSLMATNAEQALRIKELEQQLKSVDEVHSSAVKDLESQLAQKDFCLWLARKISVKDSQENEAPQGPTRLCPKREDLAIRELLPTVVERLLQSHEYKQSLSVPFNFALQTGWGQGLAEERSEKELHKIMMRMNGFLNPTLIRR